MASGYASAPARYDALLAEIAAGVALHYGAGRSGDPDLDLLDGDRRFAEGLIQLAELGDLEATRILGDAISAVARAQADGDVPAAERAWERALEEIRGASARSA